MGLFSSLIERQEPVMPFVNRGMDQGFGKTTVKSSCGGGYAGKGKSFLDTFLKLALGTGGGGGSNTSQEQEQDDCEMKQGTLPTGYYERAPGGLPQIHAGRY